MPIQMDRRSWWVKFTHAYMPRVLIHMLVLLATFRVGEASHPGPILGTFNPDGLLRKSEMLATLPQPSLWGVAETHITKQGCEKFKQQLELSQVDMRFVPGAFAPRLTDTLGSLGGKAAGVGCLSSWPIRALNCSVFQEVRDSGRIQLCSAFIDSLWVHGVAYGYTPRPTITRKPLLLMMTFLGFSLIAAWSNAPWPENHMWRLQQWQRQSSSVTVSGMEESWMGRTSSNFGSLHPCGGNVQRRPPVPKVMS